MLEATGLDKVLHFVFSYVIALYSPTVSLIAGIGKEVYDVARGGVADFQDLVADWFGVLFAVIT